MRTAFFEHIAQTLAGLRSEGLYKEEAVLLSPQGAQVRTAESDGVLNLCANNYLGLADHPAVQAGARAALERWGYGLASVRFICGTQAIHHELEERLARFLGLEACILYPSCFDANGGLYETLLGPEDAVFSDALNHASIIDGIRLCKARRHRYGHADLSDLETQLRAADAAGARFKLITSDGVFSMDGTIADAAGLVDLAQRFGALLHLDECHASGFLGPRGRGTPEHAGVHGKVDLITGTLGKALGGASGGFTAGPRDVIDLLRQRSRPYLFSNTLPPVVVGGALAALDLLETSTDLRDRLESNTRRFRAGLVAAGLLVRPGTHPIVPVLLGDAALAQRFAARLREHHRIHVVGFFYPVVPLGQARIRCQVSAAHRPEDLDRAVAAFASVARELGLG